MVTKNAIDLIDAFGYLTIKEGALLQSHAKKLPEGSTCVNIGAGAGTSAVCVLEARPDLAETFYTIDVRDWDNPFGGLLNERNAFDKYVMKYPNQIHDDSKEVANRWNKKNVNFLIIDGDHSRFGVRGDILLWKDNLEKGAIIFIHDYESTRWVEVKDAVNELMYDSEEFEFIDKEDGYIVFKYLGKDEE